MSKTIHNIKLHYPPKTNLCRSCRYSYGDRKRGIMCEVTGDKPDFHLFCPYFSLSRSRDNAVHSHDNLRTSKRVKLLELWVFVFVLIVLLSPILEYIGRVSVFVIIGVILLAFSIYNHVIEKQTQHLPIFAYIYTIFAYFLGKFKNYNEQDKTIIYQTLVRFYGHEIASQAMEKFNKGFDFDIKNLKRLLHFISLNDKRLLFTLIFQLYAFDNVREAEKDEIMQQLAGIFNITTDEYFRLKHIILSREYAYQYQKNKKETRYSYSSDLDYQYRILGISPSASDSEVKRRFRLLAKMYHPDRQPNPELAQQAQEQFRLILEAYQKIKQARNMK